MSKQYYDDSGGLVFVSCGISDGSKWMTVRQKTTRAGTHRIKSPALPLRATPAKAQAELERLCLETRLG